MPKNDKDLTSQLFDDAQPEKPQPFEMFQSWFDDAKQGEINDANAMFLATVDNQGLPNCRTVLLNGLSDKGFMFFTNTQSAKGQEVADQPQACLLFHWKSSRRQVRIRGRVEMVSSDEADAYFATRPRGSQIGAHASQQSEALASRQQMMDNIEQLTDKLEGDDVPRPDHWSGYLVVPSTIEFWQNGEFRLHDRIIFTRQDEGANWQTQRLYP